MTLSARYLLCPVCRGRDQGVSAVSPTHGTVCLCTQLGCRLDGTGATLASPTFGTPLPGLHCSGPGWPGSCPHLPATLLGKITNPVYLEGANLHHLPFPPDPIPQTCFQGSCPVREPAKKFMVTPKALSHLHH